MINENQETSPPPYPPPPPHEPRGDTVGIPEQGLLLKAPLPGGKRLALDVINPEHVLMVEEVCKAPHGLCGVARTQASEVHPDGQQPPVP